MIDFKTQPRRWESAQMPVVFTFDHRIVLPPAAPGAEGLITSLMSRAEGGMVELLSVPSAPLAVGQSFYLAQGGSLLADRPVTVTAKRLFAFPNGDVYDAYLTDAPVASGISGADLYTLDYVERFNPALLLYVEDAPAGQIRYDRDLDGVFRVNLSPYLRPYFSDIGFPGRFAVEEPALFRKYRLDHVVDGRQFAGTDKYVVNAMVPPPNPPCADSLPAWAADMATLRCREVSPRSSSERVTKRIDTNPASPTFGQHQDGGAYFHYDENADACPITYRSAAITLNFTRNDCPAGQVGSTVPVTLPAGAATSLISQNAADQAAYFQLNQTGQAAANAGGSCTVPNPRFEYRNQAQAFPSPGAVQVRADLWMVNPAGGLATFYYTETTKSDGTVTGTQTRTAAMNGSELLLLSSVLLLDDTPSTPALTREFTNIRLTP